MSSRNENLSGLTSMTTAVRVNMAAEAPTKVVSAENNGRLSRKLKIPPVKNAESKRSFRVYRKVHEKLESGLLEVELQQLEES